MVPYLLQLVFSGFATDIQIRLIFSTLKTDETGNRAKNKTTSLFYVQHLLFRNNQKLAELDLAFCPSTYNVDLLSAFFLFLLSMHNHIMLLITLRNSEGLRTYWDLISGKFVQFHNFSFRQLMFSIFVVSVERYSTIWCFGFVRRLLLDHLEDRSFMFRYSE